MRPKLKLNRSDLRLKRPKESLARKLSVPKENASRLRKQRDSELKLKRRLSAKGLKQKKLKGSLVKRLSVLKEKDLKLKKLSESLGKLLSRLRGNV